MLCDIHNKTVLKIKYKEINKSSVNQIIFFLLKELSDYTQAYVIW